MEVEAEKIWQGLVVVGLSQLLSHSEWEMETKLQQLNSKQNEGRESTEEFEEIELEVKQKLQDKKKKR